MRFRWITAGALALALVGGAIAGAFALWFYERSGERAAAASIAEQRAVEAREFQAHLADVTNRCPEIVHQADAAVAPEAIRYRTGHNTVERAYDQRAHVAELDGRLFVAGELSIRQAGGYREHIRYIRPPSGVIQIRYERFEDARFDDTWLAIVTNSLCTVYD